MTCYRLQGHDLTIHEIPLPRPPSVRGRFATPQLLNGISVSLCCAAGTPSAVPRRAPKLIVKKGQPPVRERLDGVTPQPLPKSLYDDPAMNPLLLGKYRPPKETPDAPTPKWEVRPEIKKTDYLLKQVPEEKKNWQPPKIMNAEQADEEPTLGRAVMQDLCETFAVF